MIRREVALGAVALALVAGLVGLVSLYVGQVVLEQRRSQVLGRCAPLPELERACCLAVVRAEYYAPPL